MPPSRLLAISDVVPVVAQGLTPVENVQARNTDIVLLASAARTADPTVVPPENLYCRGVRLTLDITVTPNNAETLTMLYQHFDPTAAAGAGRYMTFSAFTAITASVINGALPYSITYTIHPDFATTGVAAPHTGIAASLGRLWRSYVDHSSTGSWTYSLGATLLL